MNLRLGLFTIFLFSLCRLAIGQDFQYQNFNELNGLPSSETYEVFQDSRGFIWIATDRGISRYDGGEFRNFAIRDGLSDNTVFGFYEDYQNRIWFRTYSGALSYFQNDSILHYAHNEVLIRELGRSILEKIYIDTLDNLWFSSFMPGKAGRIDKDGNISMIEDGKEEYLFLHHISDQNYLIGYTPRSSKVHTLKIKDTRYPVEVSNMNSGSPHFSYASWDDQLLISINRDIFCFCQGTLKKVYTSELGIINLLVDNENSLWVGFFDGGVKKFSNGQFNSFEVIPILQKESVGNVLRDREGGLWFSTLDRGIFYIPNIEIDLLLWKENAKVSCATASNNKLYVGNYQGELTALDAPSKRVLWSKNFGFPINSLFVDSRENIWVCDIKQLQCFSPTGDKIFGLQMIQAAKCYQEANDGSVWVGNNTGLFKVSTTGKVLSHGILQKRISSLFVTDSVTYVGSLNGLATYSKDLLQKEDSYINIKSRISTLHEFSPGVLLIGTIGEGLIILSKDHLIYTNKKNSIGDIIYAITQVKDDLWIST
ncbi:MAG: hypothetical protein JJE09_12050, partial [Bacteroidia bacterium]|nr:hypothetical protein [Bacteroidia bacterium]